MLRGHGGGRKAERRQDAEAAKRAHGQRAPPCRPTGRATKCGGSVRGVYAVLVTLNRGLISRRTVRVWRLCPFSARNGCGVSKVGVRPWIAAETFVVIQRSSPRTNFPKRTPRSATKHYGLGSALLVGTRGSATGGNENARLRSRARGDGLGSERQLRIIMGQGGLNRRP